MTLIATEYEEEIPKIIKHSGSDVSVFIFVDDIKAWCDENNVKGDKSDTTGKCLQNRDGKSHTVLIQKEIRSEEIENIKLAMVIRGSKKEDVAILDNYDTYLRHLVFHECAHAFNHEFTELECDNWAFEKLSTYEI
jgi:hypothetical protein